MKALEQKALSLGAHTVTLNTLCSIAGSTKELWASIGVEYDPKTTRLMEYWYKRLGYGAYKREPRYKEPTPDGGFVKLQAVVSYLFFSLSFDSRYPDVGKRSTDHGAFVGDSL